jgi:hypothetical protein
MVRRRTTDGEMPGAAPGSGSASNTVGGARVDRSTRNRRTTMSRIIDGPSVEPVARGLLGAIDIGDGGTSEQRNVLAAIVSSYWGRPDLTLETLEPMGPEEFASTIAEPAARRRFREFMVMLELCRHPLDDAQVALVDSYAAAMGVAGPGLDLARVLLREGSARAYADLVRFREVSEPAWAEPSLVERYMTRNAEPDAADLELAARLRSLQGLPEGTLGREYVEFYRRQGVTLPGDDPRHEPCDRRLRHDRTGRDRSVGDAARHDRQRRPLGPAPHEPRRLRGRALRVEHVHRQGGRSRP